VPSASCGSSDVDACRAFFEAACEHESDCNPVGATIYGYPDVSTCVERNTLLCPVLVALPSSNFRGDALARCADAIAASSCTAFEGPYPEACLGATRGGLQPGDGCVDSAQCDSGTCFQPANATRLSCGSCAALVAEGDRCSGIRGVCDSGLVCLGGRCAVAKKQGEPCSNVSECMAGLACVDLVCGAPHQKGETCGNDRECDLANGLYCDPMLGVCSTLPASYWNGACGIEENGQVESIPCHAGFFCDFSRANTVVGNCSPQLPDGASCAGQVYDPCQPPARCDAGVCTLPVATACTP
jgi:hypothetical protein